MADINVVLRDLDGNHVAYEGVNAVNLPTEDGGIHPFYALEKLNQYLIRRDQTDYTKIYIIRAGTQTIHQNSISEFFTDVEVRENGRYSDETDKYTIGILFTPKTLTIGKTYTDDEAFG